METYCSKVCSCGEEIDAALESALKAVRVDQQTLTEEQKVQVRRNLGIEDSGEGFAGPYSEISISEGEELDGRRNVTIWGSTTYPDGEVIVSSGTVRDGVAGKSAYAYAQDGGFTGTEAEFAERMANGGSTGGNTSGGNVDYVLPVGGDELGGVKNGGNVVINADGTMTAPEASAASIYAGATAPTDGSLVWIDTTEDDLVLEIDSTAWVSGYTLNAQGGLSVVSDDTDNTAVNYAFIPVEGGATYTLYNSADETWTSDSVLVACFTNDAAGKDELITLFTGNPFKVPKKCAYILIASQNVDADNFANMLLVKSIEVALTRISATYSGGDVEVGTDVSALTGIVVTAHYSDGTSATVTGYTLSGTIAEGNNVITVSYNGKTTTFTVMGVSGESNVTLSSISATYSGGDVEEGTALSELTGITVTATYSDGSTATVTDYTLSGEIAEGENAITVSYGGKSTTITVAGIADSGGETTGSTLNPDNWKYGYFSTSGSVTASSTNGEMYYDEFIPVIPGETYCFYNTVEDWTTGWTGFMQYGEDYASKGRFTPGSNADFLKFTVNADVYYIKPSLRNMVNYYETAVMYHCADIPVTNMPIESTTWETDCYINSNGNVVSGGTNSAVTGFISVDGGATYRLSNANAEWNTAYTGIAYYYVNRVYAKISNEVKREAGTSIEFTVPADANYIRLSSNNLLNFYATATLEKIS